jgi:putative ABC transport system ATP-binding protein
VHALRDVNLSADATVDFGPIRRGEFVMIRGPSGGGKTTLLNILGAIDDATSGSIELFGESVDGTSRSVFLVRVLLVTLLLSFFRAAS